MVSRRLTEADLARDAMQAIAEELDVQIDEERGVFPALVLNGARRLVGGVIQGPSDITVYTDDGGEHTFSYARDYPKLLTALVKATIGGAA